MRKNKFSYYFRIPFFSFLFKHIKYLYRDFLIYQDVKSLF